MIAEQFDAFLFDLDGVVYVGEKPTPGAVEALDSLRKRGASIRFLTNNPRPSRHQVVDRLVALGIDAVVDEVATAGWAAAHYATDLGAETVVMVGTDGLATELRAAGLDIVEEGPDAVVVGAAPDTDYGDIHRASRAIRDGASFIATNPDAYFPKPGGPEPGTGSIVRAVEVASATRPTFVGKPEPRLFEFALEGIDGDAVVVGDNPETDILGAHRAELTAIHVGTEIPSFPADGDFRNPDATIETLGELFDSGVTVSRWERPNFDWPDNVRPAVSAIVRDYRGRVMLVPDGEGGWALPTATVARAETVPETVRRVVRDQVGVDATVGELVGVYSDPAEQIFTAPDGEIVQRVTTCVVCEVPSDDTDGDAMFFDQGALPNSLAKSTRSMLDDAFGDGGPVVR